MPDVAKKRLHVPLPPELHDQLKQEAEAAGTPATVLARAALEEWLARRRRARIAEDLRAFATEAAGTELDLDEEFEAAATETMTERTR